MKTEKYPNDLENTFGKRMDLRRGELPEETNVKRGIYYEKEKMGSAY
jgi:hypothetical protein